MKSSDKKLIQSLNGQIFDHPPVWMMRQAGRYLPEYRATRAKAGDFLSLCYNPELAAEVTLQPIRRYGFDASILFADILLVPQALGADLWFETGEGPRLSTITTPAELSALKPVSDIHETLQPIYETIKILKRALPNETALIGFAGAPWTVATYMIAGRGTKDHAPARQLMYQDRDTFNKLMDLITKSTSEYLLKQIEAGAEVIKIFDSWASSLPGLEFEEYAIKPINEITNAIHKTYPDIPIIAFPRGAGGNIISFENNTNVQGIALDTSVDLNWADQVLPKTVCLQGNLDPTHLISGGGALVQDTKAICKSLKNRPHIFNLGHGITPDGDPDHVSLMVDTIRETA